jgi:hypothetical protein
MIPEKSEIVLESHWRLSCSNCLVFLGGATQEFEPWALHTLDKGSIPSHITQLMSFYMFATIPVFKGECMVRNSK